MYTTEQYAQLAQQLSVALKNYEFEMKVSQGLRQSRHELEQQVEELLSTIATLQVENTKLKQIAKYE